MRPPTKDEFIALRVDLFSLNLNAKSQRRKGILIDRSKRTQLRVVARSDSDEVEDCEARRAEATHYAYRHTEPGGIASGLRPSQHP